MYRLFSIPAVVLFAVIINVFAFVLEGASRLMDNFGGVVAVFYWGCIVKHSCITSSFTVTFAVASAGACRCFLFNYLLPRVLNSKKSWVELAPFLFCREVKYKNSFIQVCSNLIVSKFEISCKIIKNQEN